MNQSNRNIVIWVIIIIVLILGIVAWQYFGSQRASNTPLPSSNENANQQAQLITAKHQYKNGKHIVAGEVDLPTPCHILNTDFDISKSLPEVVTIKFTSSSQADTCAQVVTPARFKVEFTASENAVINATWNGQPATLNLVPVGPGEDIENFEVFIKG